MEVVRAGTVIANKYRVQRILGAGGMGIVVAALDEQAGQSVAIKLLLPELADKPLVVKRFLREARAISSLRSEHVTRVFDVGTTRLPGLEAAGDVPFFAMELLEGSNVAQVIRSRSLTPQAACRCIIDACAALQEAHELGIVHRDLKPSNLFVATGKDATVCLKVLDFGVSKLTDSDDTTLTQSQTFLGSPSYMSPEQLLAPQHVDRRSDVWSLGVILYEMLANQRPFVGETMPALAVAITSESPPRLSEVNPEVPLELEAIVMRCLNKDVVGRYDSASALSAALAPFAGGRSLPIPVIATSGERREAMTSPGPENTTEPDASVAGNPRRKRATVAGAMVLLASAGASAAAWPLWQRYRATEPPVTVAAELALDAGPTRDVPAPAPEIDSAQEAAANPATTAPPAPRTRPQRPRSTHSPAPSAGPLFDGRKW